MAFSQYLWSGLGLGNAPLSEENRNDVRSIMLFRRVNGGGVLP